MYDSEKSNIGHVRSDGGRAGGGAGGGRRFGLYPGVDFCVSVMYTIQIKKMGRVRFNN